MKYVDDRSNGKVVQEPSVQYPIHTMVLKYFKGLFANEKKMADSTKKMMGITAKRGINIFQVITENT